jgi:hypothetical protein
MLFLTFFAERSSPAPCVTLPSSHLCTHFSFLAGASSICATKYLEGTRVSGCRCVAHHEVSFNTTVKCQATTRIAHLVWIVMRLSTGQTVSWLSSHQGQEVCQYLQSHAVSWPEVLQYMCSPLWKPETHTYGMACCCDEVSLISMYEKVWRIILSLTKGVRAGQMKTFTFCHPI